MASAMRSSAFRQAFAAQRQFTMPARTASRISKIASPAFGATRVAAFHASQKKEILPPLPQRILGTVNDPAPTPPSSPSHGSYHWTMERGISVALVPLTIAPFAAGSLNPILDATFIAALLVHSHIGFQSIIIDYVPTKRLPKTRKLFWYGLNLATVVVGIGFYEFETNDVGLVEGVKRVWTA
ncbi:succinate dehydrogenase [ubiquinone] cytochrome b small subunit [Elsinoe australis]|uniref:Succinate dehydrogenase [ubiquinone] cytochrome b small subunit n=1 Tax=Elsinoe australis TaxID=40998 RepID=A0A2P7ZUJ7_9PEZI|nr:Oligosaccharide translocation protein rft1 [Elsinoe australis]TKX19326.1 succinate dehydrogenase [ubiquinone] cytochrome b small subunit [Elsinoe australis]